MHESRATGGWKIRPSSILLVLFAIFYFLAGIDIIPESIVKPRIIGYIDDLIIIMAVASYTYKDWSDIDAIQFRGLPRTGNGGEDQVPMGDRHEDSTNNSSSADSSVSSVLHSSTEDTSASVSTTLGSMLNTTSNDDDSGENVETPNSPESSDAGSSSDEQPAGEITEEERLKRRAERRAARAAANKETTTRERVEPTGDDI